jgi:hypothetical protein
VNALRLWKKGSEKYAPMPQEKLKIDGHAEFCFKGIS